MTFSRFIPKDSTPVEHAHGVVYTYSAGARPLAIAYSGKRTKADWHFRFRTEEERSERIRSFFASLDAHVQHKAERRQQRTRPHTLALGDVIYNSWGYDQTNVDFYEVVKASANHVWLQPIARTLKETGFMSGEATPYPGQRYGEITQHRVTVYNAGNSVHFEFGAGSKWDGKPKYCSWYA
jgi:hypothetical protein